MTSCPQYGHFYPMVPLGWALRGAGHQVRVAVPENFVVAVAQSGLPAVPVGGVVRTRDIMGGGDGNLLDAWASDPVGMHVQALRLVSRFALHLAEPIITFCRQTWAPDLVVHPTLDFSGPLIAHALGVPAVSLSPGLPIAEAAVAAAHDELADLYGEWGYRPDDAPAAVRLQTWPASLLANPGQSMRYVPYNGPETLPTWLLGPAPTSKACLTLGSILPKTGGLEVLPGLITALHDLVEQVVVVLPHEAAEALADIMVLPSGVRIADTVTGPWLALNMAMEGSALVVHHGGAGTTQTAFSMGIPQLVVPRMADQFDIADAVVRSGAGLALRPSELTPETARETVAELTGDTGYGRGAAAVRHEMAAQPHPGRIAAMLEDLVAHPQPARSRPCG